MSDKESCKILQNYHKFLLSIFLLQLVCFSVVAVALAEEEAAKPALLPALGYPYAFGGYPYAYAHAPVQVAAPEITLVSILYIAISYGTSGNILKVPLVFEFLINPESSRGSWYEIHGVV